MVPLLKLNHAFLVPLIVFSIPPLAISHQMILVATVLASIGLAGMLLGSQTAARLTSLSLLLLIVWGKVVSDIYRLPAPDSALLLLQFLAVIFFMEVSSMALTFDSEWRRLQGRSDEASASAIVRAEAWAREQIVSLGRLTLSTFVLSLGLLLFSSLASVSSSQLAFSGILALSAVITLLVLLIHRREGEPPEILRD